MQIAVRLDDLSPDMDWAKFNRFREMMERYHVKPLVGIIPENRDPQVHKEAPHEDFWDLMKKLQSEGWILAMHGCYHVYTTTKGGLFPLNHLSEFAGLSFEKQDELIETGRSILREHGIETDIFMAPAHSFDRNTLKALKKNGFTRMTDGFGNRPYSSWGMEFYPISFQASKTLSGGDGATTLVVHTAVMDESDFARYEKIFAEQELLPYSEFLYMESGKRGFIGNAKQYCMAAGKRMLVSMKSAKAAKK